jgi:hypothetical protein
LILPLLSLALAVQQAGPSRVYSGRDGDLSVDAPRVESPRISVDGRLDESEWGSAAVLTGFTQYTPVEGVAASQRTEVRVFYAADAIYFGIHAYDDDPDGILVHYTERDRSSFGDDWVRIMLDTFDDQRQAYAFFVNPYGIQTDGMWQESIRPMGSPTGPKVDFNPDFIWDSMGRVVDDGWIAEIRIPYVSLRFPRTSTQDWGLQIARGVTRSDFKSSWAPLTLEVSSVLAQSGRLVGLHDIRPKRLVEINPVATGKLEGAQRDGAFRRGSVEPQIGGNARVGITPNLVLNATVNPDFSQVEADVDQIQVNERFALFFPEKRPFFLEGSEIYRTTQRLVHTRRIVDPIAGAKLTGKVGATSVAWLGSVDQSPSTVFGGTGNAVFNLVRVRRDVGSGSSLGMLYTDRTVTGGSGAYNRVASADARFLFGGRYTLETQATASWTATGAAGEAVRPRPFVTVYLDRSGRDTYYHAKLEDIHPDFRASSGYIPRVGDTEAQLTWGFNRYGPVGATLERWGVEARSNNFFDHQAFWDGAGPYEYEIELQPTVTFRGARSLTAILRWGNFLFQPDQFAGHEVQRADGSTVPYPLPPDLHGMLAAALIPNVRFDDRLRLTGLSYLREIPLFDEGDQGLELRLAPSLEITPDIAWKVNLSYTWARLWRSADHSVFSTVNLSRVRLQYQFGRSVFARVIGQYDLERQSALRHPVTGEPVLIGGVLQDARDRGTFQGQALLSYEPSPGTIFFVGYSRLMEGPYGYGLGAKEPIADGFFLKLSYLFRL